MAWYDLAGRIAGLPAGELMGGSQTGEIGVGKRADLVVLRANPLSVSPGEIADYIPVELTLVGGKTVCDRCTL